MKYPVCVLCGRLWRGDGDTLYCTGEDSARRSERTHDVVWYFVGNGNDDSIHREVTVDGNEFSFRWNCDCMVSDCRGKNVVYTCEDYDSEKLDRMLWLPDVVPFDVSRDQLEVWARAAQELPE